MNFPTLAYAKIFVPGDPTALDPAERQDKWIVDRSFRCHAEPITAEQIVRAGRDSAERQVRVYYRAFNIDLDNSSRVSIAGKDYDVVYAFPAKSKLSTVYVDCREVV